VTVGNLDDYGVACRQCELFGISEELFPPVLKPNFYNIKDINGWHVHIRQPIENIHFIATAGFASAVVFTTCYLTSGR
jgi:hypothetical protein